MHIRCGYRIEVVNNLPTPAILLLDPHPSRDRDSVSGPTMDGTEVPCVEYMDGFGNRWRRLVIPPGGAAFANDMIIADSGEVDAVDRNAPEVFPGDLPSEVFAIAKSTSFRPPPGNSSATTPRAGTASSRSATM